MPFSPVDERTETYMRQLSGRHDEPVLLEMERLGHERNFPIIDRLVGELVEVLALSIGAASVFEMGSGYGYSAYWFTRAVGPRGRVICTDSNPANRELAERFLSRVDRWDRIDYQVGIAQDVLGRTRGDFDVVYNDIDKPTIRRPGASRASASARAACTSATTCCGPVGSARPTTRLHRPRPFVSTTSWCTTTRSSTYALSPPAMASWSPANDPPRAPWEPTPVTM